MELQLGTKQAVSKSCAQLLNQELDWAVMATLGIRGSWLKIMFRLLTGYTDRKNHEPDLVAMTGLGTHGRCLKSCAHLLAEYKGRAWRRRWEP